MYTLHQVPSEAQIRKYLRSLVFGKNVFCPSCRCRGVVARQERYHCPRCRRRFSLLSATWLADMKLPLPAFWLLLWCWTTQIPVRQTMALTHRSDEAVRRWYSRFRDHLPEEVHILEHIVQLDEAFFRERTLLMGKEKGTRKLGWDVLLGTAPDRRDATRFLFQKVKPGSKLWTDGAAIYRGIDKWWPVEHSSDLHRKFEFAHTSEIEGIFGNYRTFVRRMYHHHWSENLPEYVREFCFRFSSPEIFASPRDYLSKTISPVPLD